jgi:phosphoglycerate kinase
LVIAGGMANTFLHALGREVGRSLCERDLARQAREILAKADAAGCAVILPADVVIAPSPDEAARARAVEVRLVPAEAMILDFGPATAQAIANAMTGWRTLVWNGPLGLFEVPPFDAATRFVAQAAARLTRAGKLKTIAGGGDTVAALAAAGVVDDFSYVSTAGGAFLEWLEGKELPGVAALRS